MGGTEWSESLRLRGLGLGGFGGKEDLKGGGWFSLSLDFCFRVGLGFLKACAEGVSRHRKIGFFGSMVAVAENRTEKRRESRVWVERGRENEECSR